jgi:hypothetical protein
MSLLFSLHFVDGLKEIDYNHKKFCELNGYKYNKILIPNSTAAKYAFILQQMQNNIGKNIIFIDSNSYFKTFKLNLTINKSIFVQKVGEDALDDFIFLNSNDTSIRIIDSIYREIKTKTFTKQADIVPVNYPNDYYQEYPFKYENVFINIDCGEHHNASKIDNILVLYVNSRFYDQKGLYFADAFLKAKNFSHLSSDERYELINPGHKKALVMLYTKEIKEYAIAAEKNIINYCKKNNMTLHLYREKPVGYENASGSWCKPKLILDHLEQHEIVAWIDADILLTKDFKFDFNGDIGLYHDPAGWFFNSGFMWFKNNEKNRNMLNSLVQEIISLTDLSGVYSNNGDQFYFIKQVKSYYPDIIVNSNLFINAYPTYPVQIDPKKHPAMIHFMGFTPEIRENVMKGYAELIEE